MTDEEARQQVERTDRFIAEFRANPFKPAAAGSLTPTTKVAPARMSRRISPWGSIVTSLSVISLPRIWNHLERFASRCHEP